MLRSDQRSELQNLPLILTKQEAHWHDERDRQFKKVNFDECWGLILNTRGHDQVLKLLADGRHWFGIKKFGGTW